jgi:hypothetical protein
MKRNPHMIRNILRAAGLGALLLAATACSTDSSDDEDADKPHPVPTGEAFATPEEAMQAVVAAAAADDSARLQSIFTAEGIELLRSGDPLQDKEDVDNLVERIHKGLTFADGPRGSRIAQIGPESWPFAIPLVQTPEGWRFDVVTGAEEVDNRRVGRNEISTIATLRAFVEAQREYQAVAHDGLARCYAQRVLSSDGKRDGLYWPTAEGEPESPFGPLVADAASEGRTLRKEGEEPKPYHGYEYRMLKSQGAKAPGGARAYVDKDGLMTGGFAAIAWPTKYDSSGVMTFVVNQRGIVFQKDLGDETTEIADAITEFDPDDSWDPVDEEE